MSLLHFTRPGLLLIAASLAACGRADESMAPVEPTLTVTGIYPTWGLVSGGTEVTVGGAGFQKTATVTFGGMPATGLRVISRHQMYVVAPAHPPGDVDVVVSNPDGRNTSAPMRYSYLERAREPGPWDY